jgi:hypothetical protein
VDRNVTIESSGAQPEDLAWITASGEQANRFVLSALVVQIVPNVLNGLNCLDGLNGSWRAVY